ncbi:MAG: serine hydrolase [Acidobacteria bacterium]|nr:serine hydrolase [Acidobacteriota bacterium]
MRFVWPLLLASALCWAQVYPGRQWERIADPASAGYSSRRLESLRSYVQTLDTTALMVVVGGKVLFEQGDVARLSYLASARKSVLAMLYGNYVAAGKIDLSKTIKDLGVTDHGGLLPVEQQATIEHLITARSGVYHDASNAGDAPVKPARGSKKPGEFFLYNNWDFNAAGAIFEKLTGRDIYDALESDLARPVEMQDFDRTRQRKSGDLDKSVHPAYHMWLSTRDMARIGYLMLREGNWAGKQLVPREWARRIVSIVSPVPAGTAAPYGWGYGYMWWVADPETRGPFAGAYTARGAVGQFITVLPSLDMVIAHKTDPQGGQANGPDGAGRRAIQVNNEEYSAILALIAAARRGR